MNTNLCSTRRRASRGFTLIELLIVLTITSLMLGTAAPTFANFVRAAKLTTATNDFLTGISLARSEAIKRNARVAMCKSSDGVTCAPTGGWEQGWIVFLDASNDGARQSSEKIVWRAQPMATGLRETGNTNVSRYISYSPTGEAKLAGGGFQAGTITLCNVSSTTENARQIIISSSGRARVQKTHVANCA